MTTLFARMPRLTILMVFLILAAGLGALATMGRQEDPTLVERYAIITTPFPGASAERVEALITEPLEDRVLELAEVRTVESFSRSGISVLSVELREDLSEPEVDQAWSLVRDQVDLARQDLPAGALPTEVDRQYIGAATLLVALTWDQDGAPNLGILTRLAADLEDRLQSMAGTEETRTFGAASEEIRVLADVDRLAAIGLTAGDVARRIAAADAKAPAGQVPADQRNVNVEIAGELETLSRVRQIPVTQTNGGDTIRVADLAEVKKGWRDPQASMALVDGEQGVLVAAYLQPGLRVDSWTASAMDVVSQFKDTLPVGVTGEVIFEQNTYVNQRLNGLALNLLASAIIVFAVLFFVLGWRSALIVGSALPLTIVMVIAMVNFAGQPLHQMSVTGLVIALGLLIDNPIVIMDEYRLRRSRGMGILEAVHDTVGHLFAPLLASTTTTMLAFAPIAILPGSAGEFVGTIGLSVMFAVAASWFLSFTVVPAFAAWFDGEPEPGEQRRFWRDGIRVTPVMRVHRGLVRAAASAPLITLLVCLIAPVFGFFAMIALMPSQFFPPTDRDMFQMELVAPNDASLMETRRLVERANDLVEEVSAEFGDVVTHVGWVVGDAPPRTYYNVTGFGDGQPNFAAGWARTTGPEQTRAVVTAIQDRARAVLPEARFRALPFEQGPPVEAPVEVVVYGPNFGELAVLGEAVRARLAASDNVIYTQASLELGRPVMRVEADEAATGFTGRTLTDLAGAVRDDLDGAVGGSLFEAVEELPVRVILDGADRSTLAAVRSKTLPQIGPGAGSDPTLGAPISALGDVTLEPELAVITRKNGERINTLSAFIQPFTLPAVALSSYQDQLADNPIVLPKGYRIGFGGEAEASGDAMGNLFGAAGPLLVMMVLALVLAFNSFRFAGVVGFVGVLSIGIAMMSVWAFGEPRGFNAIIGAMGLVGLAINGAIVVLSALRADQAAVNGDMDAIVDVTADATRHIVATTLTTIGGFMPLILSGDSFWLPLAAAIAGGVSGSAILALYLAPALFALLQRRKAPRQDADPSRLGLDATAPAE